MTKKELEMKLKDTENKLKDAIGLSSIYEGGITKKELKMFAAKWAVIGFVVGVILCQLV